ncbi:MAG: hypothetical protein Q6K95_00355 [Gloeomargarita sp. GXS_bins_116]
MTTATQEAWLPRTLLGALACLDVDVEQELGRWREDRQRWGPGWWAQFLADHPTPPPETAWTFPPAAEADPTVVDQSGMELDRPAGEPVAPPGPDLAPVNTSMVAPPDQVSRPVEEGSGAAGEVTELASRPSWSERLNRVFARRQAEGGSSTVDPWAEMFSASFHQPNRARGLRQPVLGFAIGVTLATLGTIAVLGVGQRSRTPEPTAPTLSVPAPPPESAVLPSPVPNLAHKELPDLSAVPTASPPATPKSSTNPGLYYVVMDYENEQSLLQAQRVVPEAFVWQFDTGLKVQLGAFELRDQAEAFVADLKAKGLQARVYP